MTDPIVAFQTMLQAWAQGFLAASSDDLLPIDLPQNLHRDEAAGFLRALQHEIVLVDEQGRCRLPAINRLTRNPTEPRLVGIERGRIRLLWREYLTQVGAVASLILDYGWPPAQVALDPKDWTFDAATFFELRADAPMVIAVETKKTATELQRLLSGMEVLCAAGDSSGAARAADASKKYAGLLRERPQLFWAVAPGVRRAFQPSYTERGLVLVEVEDLPSYAALTQGHHAAC